MDPEICCSIYFVGKGGGERGGGGGGVGVFYVAGFTGRLHPKGRGGLLRLQYLVFQRVTKGMADKF